MTNDDPRDARTAELEAQLAARDALTAVIEAQVRLALERISELEAKLAQNSRTSSKPPSSDPSGAVRRPGEPSDRKPGGQPGHKVYKR